MFLTKKVLILCGFFSVFPAQAGVFRCIAFQVHLPAGIPRASGGVPGQMEMFMAGPEYSPRKRGCSSRQRPCRRFSEVFPAQAGVFPEALFCDVTSWRIPRASGGVPADLKNSAARSGYSPRKRGCSPIAATEVGNHRVFPAQAGVFLHPEGEQTCRIGIPRASGGVPEHERIVTNGMPYSPRKRGCSVPFCRTEADSFVFPAQAGVFPACSTGKAHPSGIPRASGGVPT